MFHKCDQLWIVIKTVQKNCVVTKFRKHFSKKTLHPKLIQWTRYLSFNMRNVYSRKCTTSSGEKQKPRPVVSGMMMVGEGGYHFICDVTTSKWHKADDGWQCSLALPLLVNLITAVQHSVKFITLIFSQ